MLRYRLLLLVLTLPLVVLSLWHAIKYRDAKLFLQRLGFALPASKKSPIWIHAASVGEVNAVIPFIKLFKEQHADKTLLVTTNTPTGKQVIKKHFPGIAHSYLCLDWKLLNRRFINNIKPCCALIFETEIWPNLFVTLNNKNIPLIIFNGRVSQKTLRAQQHFASAYQAALNNVSHILARSDVDRDNFIHLGAAEEKTVTVGNIKYAACMDTDVAAIELGRPYILAASTRDGEEKVIVDALKELLDEHLLVIAPRHPQRLAEIEKDLEAFKLNIAVRSRNEHVSDTTNIYLADTLGELNCFIAGAEFVLMGGAFLPFGGHNILEAGQAAKAVIFGMHMDNFSDEAASFLKNNAAIQVSNEQELKLVTSQLIAQPDEAKQMGNNGQALMKKNAGIAQTYLDKISQLCNFQ
jgi:3-deoxy-D-manno-octulosonic-acid transferase